MPETVRYNFTDDRRRRRRESGQGSVMDWARILAYVTGTVDQELLARNEYMAAGPAPNVIRHGIDLASRGRPRRCRRRTVT